MLLREVGEAWREELLQQARRVGGVEAGLRQERTAMEGGKEEESEAERGTRENEAGAGSGLGRGR